MRKPSLSEEIKRLLQKFTRFTKQQKVFVLYLFLLILCMVFLPIIRISPFNAASHSVWLFNIHLLKTLLIVAVCLVVLVAWNISFKFKNFVIGYFGFKENDALVNFGFLFLIATSFLSISDTINVIGTTTQTIKVTNFGYYFIQVFLLLGLILTLLSVIKHAKENGSKTKIVNVVDEESIRDIHNKQSIKWLFEEDHVAPHHEQTVHHEPTAHHEYNHDEEDTD